MLRKRRRYRQGGASTHQVRSSESAQETASSVTPKSRTWREAIHDFMARFALMTGHKEMPILEEEIPPEPPAPDATWPHHKITFSTKMKLREMTGIAVRNGILNILTLTLYRFWARTRVRHYLWSRIKVLDDSVEYTGTSLELFLGFVVILLILVIPLVGASLWMRLFVEPDSPFTIPYGIAVYLGFAFLYGAAKYRTHRYRLSRTLWRGVRMGLKGSWISYAIRTLLFIYLTFATLLWAYPLQRFVLMRQIMSSTTIGDRRFHFDGDPTELYTSYAVAWFMSLIGLIIGGIMGLRFVTDVLGNSSAFQWTAFDASILNLSTDEFAFILVSTLVFYAIAGIVLSITMACYRAKELRYFAECTRLDGLRFTFRAGGWSVMYLNLINTLILIFTFGFGLPITQMRTFRYWFTRIRAEGEIDLDGIAQSDAPYPWAGEGLAEFFDIGAV